MNNTRQKQVIGLHQTWKSKTVIPKKYQAWKQSFVDIDDGPDYMITYHLHDDNDLRNLVEQFFPQYLKFYDGMKEVIERVDFARYVMMYASTENCIYADLDMEKKRSFAPILDKLGHNKEYKIVMAVEPPNHSDRIYNGKKVICNAMIFSVGNHHPFWSKLLEYIVANYKKGRNPVKNTGPEAVTKFYQQLKQENNPLYKELTILEYCSFYPEPDSFHKMYNKVSNKVKSIVGSKTFKDTECEPFAEHHWA